MLILYVETNLIMAIAKGQDTEAEEMLKNPPPGIDLMIPSFCYMEAIVVLQNERKKRNKFIQDLKAEFREATRNSTKSITISELVQYLGKALESYPQSFNDFQRRFIDTITLFRSQVTPIELQVDSMITTLTSPIPSLNKEKQLRDNLILQCILDHAQQHPAAIKIFLTNNSNEFGKQEIQEILQQVGINKYFTNAKNFLGWLESQK